MGPFLLHALGSGTPWAPQHTAPVFFPAAATLFLEGWKLKRARMILNWGLYDWDEVQVRERFLAVRGEGSQGKEMHHVKPIMHETCVYV